MYFEVLAEKLQAHSIAVGPNFPLQQIFLIFIYKIKELVLPFMGGGEKLKVKIRKLTIKLKLHVYINLNPPQPDTIHVVRFS